MDFRVIQQGDAVKKQKGGYASFPSLAQDPQTNEIILLYRRAIYDDKDKRPGMGAHGLEGNLYFKPFSTTQKQFLAENLLYQGNDYPPGLIDGNITTVGSELMMFLRRYPNDNPVFYTKGPSIHALASTQLFPSDDIFKIGAQWGRVVAIDSGKKWLQVFYGGSTDMPLEAKEKRVTRPGLYQSLDQGSTWQFLSWITPIYLAPNICANETAMVYANGVLYTLMRTAGEYPGALFLAYSKDEGKTWSLPEKTALFGEAPMFYVLPSGQILTCFRGFLEKDPEQGGTFSLAEFNPTTKGFSTPFVVETYNGNHYDGGYGDMIWLEDLNQLLVVYYYSNKPKPRNPWLRYALLTL